MPPKKTDKRSKVSKLPKQKAKVGAIFSGISRAAPCSTDIGSMVNVIGGPSRSLSVSNLLGQDRILQEEQNVFKYPAPGPVQTEANEISSPIVQLGTFCHFCCDQTNSPYSHECVNCGAIVCEQHLPRSSGCIYLKSVEVSESEFRCPICSRIGQGKDKPLRYAFIGFGKRKKAKMAWPMAIVNLNLESMKDDYLANTVTLEMQNHYRTFQNNLYYTTLHMRGGAHQSESKKLAPGVEFITRNLKAGYPPNVFLLVDTHSDEFTGMLQHTGGHTGGTSTTITEILIAYLGERFLAMMRESSALARGNKTVVKTINGSDHWCNLTAGSRGGWRGLIMVSCGPAIRVSHHFEAVKALVESNLVDFVVAFGGSGTLPSMISTAVRSIIADIGVFGGTDVWPTMCEILISSNDFLDYTTAVLVFANTVDNKKVAECRQISKDIPATRAFGYEFKSCPTPKCQPVPADMRVHNKGQKVQLRCSLCKWRSSWVKNHEGNKHFHQVSRSRAPQLFWHHFPASTDLQNFFVEITNAERAQASASASGGQSTKGWEKKGKSKRQGGIAMEIEQDSHMADYDSDDESMVFD